MSGAASSNHDKTPVGQKRPRQAPDWIRSLVEEGLRDRFFSNPNIVKGLSEMTRQVENGGIAPAAAADELLFSLDKPEAL